MPGALRDNIWNTWVAAEIVQFYTEDWKPYLYLDLKKLNHKESPIIVSKKQQAAGVVTELAILRPGLDSLDRVREKLYSASTRQTTLVAEIAYSLLGIFNAAILVIYGEGDCAVGLLLEHIMTASGDAAILARTGRTGSYNSSLSPNLTVYNQLEPTHVPQPIETIKMNTAVSLLHSPLPDLSIAVSLHDRLNKLPFAPFNTSHLSLPVIVFPITELDDTYERVQALPFMFTA